MKNKNGFTIVELLVSLSLTIVVVIVLFEIIILLKDLFQVANVKTELLNKKSIIAEKIYSDINNRTVSRVEQCGDYCLKFYMIDSKEKIFQVDKEQRILKYDDYTIKLDETYSIGNIFFSNDVTQYISSQNNNGILTIRIPIKSKLTGDENLGLDIVSTYNTSNMAIGSLYIKDSNNNNCDANEFCKDSTYALGSKLKLGGYNWHIVKVEESSVTLLLDGNEIPNMSHQKNGVTNYSWSNSPINNYLNTSFYNELISKGVEENDIITNQTSVCDTNPGILETDANSSSCQSEFVSSNIRLMTKKEFEQIVNQNWNDTDKSFLYSTISGKWALIDTFENDNTKITQVTYNESSNNYEFVSDSYTVYLNVRPIIVLTRK